MLNANKTEFTMIGNEQRYCLEAMQLWIKGVMLNANKTEFTMIGNESVCEKKLESYFPTSLIGTCVKPVDEAR